MHAKCICKTLRLKCGITLSMVIMFLATQDNGWLADCIASITMWLSSGCCQSKLSKAADPNLWV